MSQRFVILSGSYVSGDMQAEFGRLPPSFLPLNGRRLIYHQVALAKQLGARPLITLPSDLERDSMFAEIEKSGCQIFFTPPYLSLLEAFREVIRSVQENSLYLLHGDTFVQSSSLDPDSLAVGKTTLAYNWAYVGADEKGTVVRVSEKANDVYDARNVLAGFFHFSDVPLLRNLSTNSKNFVDLIDQYCAARVVRAHELSEWYDFGHVSAYFRSVKNLWTSRAFNNLKAKKHSVEKSSVENSVKIAFESNWFNNLTSGLSPFVPKLLYSSLEKGKERYELEYLPSPLVSDLFVYGFLSRRAWDGVAKAISEYLDASTDVMWGSIAEDVKKQFPKAVTFDKTRERLVEVEKVLDVFLEVEYSINGRKLPKLSDIIERLFAEAMLDRSAVVYLHGDLHFGNIFFDSRLEQIKVIDPRGYPLFAGKPLGPQSYDFAKLAHSVWGLYDLFIVGEYDLRRDGNAFFLEFKKPVSFDLMQAAFTENVFCLCARNMDSVRAQAILLFLSMIPLHWEDRERQQALFANFLRLFKEWFDS